MRFQPWGGGEWGGVRVWGRQLHPMSSSAPPKMLHRTSSSKAGGWEKVKYSRSAPAAQVHGTQDESWRGGRTTVWV